MLKLVLHVGAPKCGSTTIQGYLTNHPIINNSGATFAYAILSREHTVIWGESVSELPSLEGSVSSSGSIDDLGSELLSVITDRFRSAANDAFISIQNFAGFVLSQESWMQDAELMKRLCNALACYFDIRVIILGREPISWLASAFWQWGYLEIADLSQCAIRTWCMSRIYMANWSDHVNRWREVTGVSRVFFIPLHRSVETLASFLEAAFSPCVLGNGLSVERSPRLNARLPEVALRFLLNYRQFISISNSYEVYAHIRRVICHGLNHASFQEAWPFSSELTADLMAIAAGFCRIALKEATLLDSSHFDQILVDWSNHESCIYKNQFDFNLPRESLSAIDQELFSLLEDNLGYWFRV